MAKNDDLNERITTAIEGQLIALLPPEEIRARVDTVIDQFFSRTKDRYSDRPQPSKFEEIVSKVLSEHSDKAIREILASPDWTAKVDGGLQITVGKGLQKVLGFDPDVIGDAAATIVAKKRAMLLGTFLGQVLSQKFNDYALTDAVMRAFNDAANSQ